MVPTLNCLSYLISPTVAFGASYVAYYRSDMLIIHRSSYDYLAKSRADESAPLCGASTLVTRQVTDDDYSCSASKPCSNGTLNHINTQFKLTLTQVLAAPKSLGIAIMVLRHAGLADSRQTMSVGVIVMVCPTYTSLARCQTNMIYFSPCRVSVHPFTRQSSVVQALFEPIGVF